MHQLAEFVLDHLFTDFFSVGVLVEVNRDNLIRLFAKHQLLRKGDSETYQETNQIRQKLRFLARLLIQLRKVSERELMLSDFIAPQYYDDIVDAVLELRQANKQLAVTLGHFIKKLAILKIGEAIRQGDKAMKEVAQNFLDLYTSSWTELVMSSTIRMQQKEKLEKVVLLPTSDDLTKLSKFIDAEIEQETVQGVPSNYVRLQKLVMAALLLFNKRRADEVATMTIGEFRLGQLSKEDKSDILQHLPVDEKTISSRYVFHS